MKVGVKICLWCRRLGLESLGGKSQLLEELKPHSQYSHLGYYGPERSRRSYGPCDAITLLSTLYFLNILTWNHSLISFFCVILVTTEVRKNTKKLIPISLYEWRTHLSLKVIARDVPCWWFGADVIPFIPSVCKQNVLFSQIIYFKIIPESDLQEITCQLVLDKYTKVKAPRKWCLSDYLAIRK